MTQTAENTAAMAAQLQQQNQKINQVTNLLIKTQASSDEDAREVQRLRQTLDAVISGVETLRTEAA